MAYEWNDKVVLVTGAATGIGSVVVRYIVEENTKHVAVLDVNQKAGVNFENELNSKFGANKVKFYQCDVTDEERLVGIFKEVAESQGGLDVVVNNAGIMNESLYRKMISINVIALMTGTFKAMEIMGKDYGGKGGTVINIASTVALCQDDLLPCYFASKSAVLQFSNCIGQDAHYMRSGVRVVAVCFGPTRTPLLEAQNIGQLQSNIQEKLIQDLKVLPMQDPESAGKGVVEAFKQAKSGSTWLAIDNLPVKDITATVTKAYDILSAEIIHRNNH